MRQLTQIIACTAIVLSWGVALAQTWPSDAQWNPILRDGINIQDDLTDANGSRNVVSDATHAAARSANRSD